MSSKLEQKVKEFEKLSFQVKYKKVVSILEILKTGDELFLNLLDLITETGDDTSEELLKNIYSMIMSMILDLEKIEKEENLNKLEKLSKKVKAIRELEEQERNTDNLDKLLEDI